MKALQLDQFLSYRFLSELNWSPDGKRAACVVSMCDLEKNSYKSWIWLYENGAFRQITFGGAEKNYIWEDEQHLLYPVRLKKEGHSTVYERLNVDSGAKEQAFELPMDIVSLQKFYDKKWVVTSIAENHEEKKTWSVQNDNDIRVLTEIPFYSDGTGYISGRRNALFVFDSRTEQLKRVSAPDQDVSCFAVNGHKLFYIANPKRNKLEPKQAQIYCYDEDVGTNTRITNNTTYLLWSLAVLGGQLVAVAAEMFRNQSEQEGQFYLVDPKTGKFTLFAANQDYLGDCVNSDCRFGKCHAYTQVGDRLYFRKTIRNASHLYCLDKAGSVMALVEREGSVDDFSVSEAGEVLVIGMYDRKLQEVYLFGDSSSKKAAQVSAFNEDALSDTYVAPPKPLQVQSCGWDIDGWVLLPKDFDEGKSYPAILDIHGGPRTAYGEVFFHEMQYWAGQGYFVFFCNPFGSTGRGPVFADSCGKFGQIDYQNIMDFTDAVLKQYPQIDPRRVGCTGGSYGGYMCNWILGHTDRFAAIATQRSISNWISFYGVSDLGYMSVGGQIGADIYSEDGIRKLWDYSPLKYARSMKTPTLILHSQEDYRCPLEQALQLFTALKENGVPSRLCCFKHESHGLSRGGKPKSRIRRLEEITNWISSYTREN